MLGFWPQFLLVLIALYFAGTVFADRTFASSVVGRWLLLIPVLMGFLPFGWHVLQIRQILLASDLTLLSQGFTTLSLALGLILLTVAIIWAWRYAFSIFLLPILLLVVYYLGPWLYLQNNLPSTLTLQSRNLTLSAALASLALLAYTAPYLRRWLRSS
jgi:hypothetical protein